jgi:hypothetical protein
MQAAFDQRTNEPSSPSRFNNAGERTFAGIRPRTLGQPFAIVLDDVVLSSPVIASQSSAAQEVSGNFTVSRQAAGGQLRCAATKLRWWRSAWFRPAQQQPRGGCGEGGLDRYGAPRTKTCLKSTLKTL